MLIEVNSSITRLSTTIVDSQEYKNYLIKLMSKDLSNRIIMNFYDYIVAHLNLQTDRVEHNLSLHIFTLEQLEEYVQYRIKNIIL